MLFGLQPMILGIAGIFLFGQKLPIESLIALIFLFGCLFTFSFESFKQHGEWKVKGLIIGIIAISLDASGVLLTRWAFDRSPWIDPIEGNFFRCLGASTGFLVLNLFKPLRITDLWLDLSKKSRWVIVFASLSGTFLSLLLYLSAVRIGHLATVSGIAITGPLFAGIIECLTQRRWPSRYLIMSFLLFAVGFSILVFYTQ
jgi:drug/metabolite transporter (DMT)-like permease